MATVFPTVTVAYRSGPRLSSLWESLQAQGSGLFPMYVVDNSPESSDAWIAGLPDVHYLARPDNPGFGASTNAGFAAAVADWHSEWAILLNPDTTVDSGFYRALCEATQRPVCTQIGAIAPMIHFDLDAIAIDLHKVLDRFHGSDRVGIYPEAHLFDAGGRGKGVITEVIPHLSIGSDILVWLDLRMPVMVGHSANGHVLEPLVWSPTHSDLRDVQLINNAGSSVFSFMTAGDIGFQELDVGQYQSMANVGAFCGAAVALRTEFFRKLGGFDPGYFLYYEDTDLSIRGTRAGYRYLFDPSIRVRHGHSQSTESGSEVWTQSVQRGQIRFATQTSGMLGGLSAGARILVGACSRAGSLRAAASEGVRLTRTLTSTLKDHRSAMRRSE